MLIGLETGFFPHQQHQFFLEQEQNFLIAAGIFFHSTDSKLT